MPLISKIWTYRMSSISEWKYHACKFTFLAMASHCTKEFHSLTTLKEFHGLIAAACSVPGPWHINKSCILSFYLSRAQLSAPVWFRLVCLIFPAIVFWPINWQLYVVNVVRPMLGNVFWRRKRVSYIGLPWDAGQYLGQAQKKPQTPTPNLKPQTPNPYPNPKHHPKPQPQIPTLHLRGDQYIWPKNFCMDKQTRWARCEIGRAHVWTPVTQWSRMPSSAWKKKIIFLFKSINLLDFLNIYFKFIISLSQIPFLTSLKYFAIYNY